MTSEPRLTQRRARLSPEQRELLEQRLRDGAAAETSGAEIPRRPNPQEPALASFAQGRLWFLAQLAPHSAFYNVATAVPIDFALDVGLLRRSVASIIERHEILRTTFEMRDAQLVQIVRTHLDPSVRMVEAESIEAARTIAEGERRLPFDLEHGPLLRVLAIRLAAARWILVVGMHHIVCDGWSMGLFFGELTAAYGALLRGERPPTLAPAIQYADWATWEREWLVGERLDRQLSYWRRQLSAAPTLEIPTDRPRPAVLEYRGAETSTMIGRQAADRLRALCSEESATPFMALVATFAAVLARWSGQHDVVIGTPTAGRPRPELESLIGFFVNSLALRVDCSGNPTFRELVRRTRDVCLGAYAHQDIPFELLIDRLGVDRDASRNPLFQVTIQLTNTPTTTASTSTFMELERATAIFDLAVHVTEKIDGTYDVRAEYSTDLFDRTTIDRLLAHWTRLLAGAVHEPERRVGELDLMDADERRLVLEEFNRTDATTLADGCVHESIAGNARETPDAVALVWDGGVLSYGQLDRRANWLAQRLVSLGVGPDAPVGVCLERSPELIAAVLAIWKAGGAYVPLDPTYPMRRLAMMLDDVAPPVVVSSAAHAVRLPLEAQEVVLLDEDWSTEDDPGPASGVAAEHLAYLLYTSGSTGVPKGVMVEHRSLANHMAWMLRTFSFDAQDRILFKTPASFDASVWELVAPLLCGGRIVVLSAGAEKDPDEIVAACIRHDVTVAQFVPSILDLIADHPDLDRCQSLRHLFAGGEALSQRLVARLRNRLPGCAVHNLYGPTEATIDATSFTCPEPWPLHTKTVPIGRPIDNVRAYVLDEHSTPVPVGVTGELYLGGVAVARGYWRRPELTAERFSPDTFVPGGRIYRTGDRARWRSDGLLEFLGRLDDQIKVRGFRIELAEVEAALAAHESVHEAAVALIDDDNGRRLVAYFTSRNGATLSVGELRSWLDQRLPGWMIPAGFFELGKMPRQPSGKIDRTALPASDAARRLQVQRHFVPPRTEVERILATLWSALLGVDRISVHDNFFELGGDSILTIQIVSRAAQAGVQISPAQMFEHQTVAELAAVATSAVVAVEDQGPVVGDVPLTPTQAWFFEQERDDPHHFNQSVVVPLPPHATDTVLDAALAALLNHHDMLRARYTPEREGHRQWIAPPGSERPLTTEPDPAALQAGLDLRDGPVFRAARLPDGQLLLVAHHLVVDGVSWRILLEDLALAITQAAAGSPVHLPAKTTPFRQWAQAQQEHAAQIDDDEIAYWRGLCPRDGSVMLLPEGEGTALEGDARTVVIELGADETQALLTELPSRYRTQINEALLSALALAFGRWSGRDQLWLHVEGHGREDVFSGVNVSRTVGWFTSVYPVLLELDQASDDPEQALHSVKEQLRAIPRRGIGYGILRYLREDPALRNELASIPAPEIAFNYLGRLGSGAGVRDDEVMDVGAARSPRQRRVHLLEVNASVEGERLRAQFTFSPRHHREETIATLAADYVAALTSLVLHTSGSTYTLSDFARARVTQTDLDLLLSKLKR